VVGGVTGVWLEVWSSVTQTAMPNYYATSPYPNSYTLSVTLYTVHTRHRATTYTKLHCYLFPKDDQTLATLCI